MCRRRFIGADFYRDEIDFGPLLLVGATSVASFLLLKTFNSLHLVTELAGNQSVFCFFDGCPFSLGTAVFVQPQRQERM